MSFNTISEVTEKVSENVPQTEEEEVTPLSEQPAPTQAAAATHEQAAVDEELDITSNKFNPLRALYTPDYRVSEQKPKVIYQNLSAFESALKRFGVWRLNKRNQPQPGAKAGGQSAAKTDSGAASSSSARPLIVEETQQRRFLPHQLPVRASDGKGGIGGRARVKRNIFTYMETITGPMAQLTKYVQEQRHVRVLVRHEHGVRGTLEGNLLCYDKHWNLWLRDVYETWQRRKFQYGVNKSYGIPEDCSWRLQELGIELPRTETKSLNRKNVEIRRKVPQMFVRGEEVVLVIATPTKSAEAKSTAPHKVKVTSAQIHSQAQSILSK